MVRTNFDSLTGTNLIIINEIINTLVSQKFHRLFHINISKMFSNFVHKNKNHLLLSYKQVTVSKKHFQTLYVKLELLTYLSFPLKHEANSLIKNDLKICKQTLAYF